MIFGKEINGYYKKHLGAILLGILALLAVDYYQLKIPEFYRMVINGINTGMVEEGVPFTLDILLDKVCLPLIITIVMIVVGRFLWRICFFGTAIKVETDLRRRMFDHCKDLSQNYYQRNKVGNLMSLFTNDLETIQECFGDGILMFCDALFLGGLALYKMWCMNAVLTILSMIPLLIMVIIGAFVGKRMMAKWEKRQEAFSSLSDFAQETFSGISVIKAFVKEVKELLAFKELNVKNEERNVEYTKFSTLLMVLVDLLTESVVCVILGYGGYLAYIGVFNAGQLVEFIGYFMSAIWPMLAVSFLIEMHSRGTASLNRISELLHAENDLKDAEGVEHLENIKGKIEFRDLSFSYEEESHPVLEHISFVVEAGDNVGIVGKTGCGKTTLVDLILRTYNVEKGTLFIDDKDVNEVAIKDVRGACAYVPQDNFLFSDTISNNISFAQKGASLSEIEEVAKLADVHDNIVDFKEGYETMLGERGVTVSGGQKQRISIARALMKEAPILILDDSVSAVDTKTEKIILDNLKNNRKGKTTLLVAHRISTIEQMDKVLFLDEGKVVDYGSHEELLERCEDYRKMVELQRLEDEIGGDYHA
ncbi:MAG: ABC transporter ATP-binding protein [Erysipelotrichaceae bacterium]|nr:ABC transporter ATP-binding protein [Erysipelotrichaceae bacterium]